MSLGDAVKKARADGITKGKIIKSLVDKGYSKEQIREAFGVEKPTVAGEKAPVVSGESYGMVKKFGMLFSKPTTFFDLVRDNGVGGSIGMLAACLGVVFVLQIVMMMTMYSAMGGGVFLGSFALISGVAIFPIYFIFTFIFAGIMHGAAKIMKGQGRFTDTYNVFAYSMAPSVILGIIPVVGLFTIIYSIVLMIFGVSSLHNLSKGKSTFAVLTPFVLFIGLIILLAFLLVMAVAGLY